MKIRHASELPHRSSYKKTSPVATCTEPLQPVKTDIPPPFRFVPKAVVALVPLDCSDGPRWESRRQPNNYTKNKEQLKLTTKPTSHWSDIGILRLANKHLS